MWVHVAVQSMRRARNNLPVRKFFSRPGFPSPNPSPQPGRLGYPRSPPGAGVLPWARDAVMAAGFVRDDFEIGDPYRLVVFDAQADRRPAAPADELDDAISVLRSPDERPSFGRDIRDRRSRMPPSRVKNPIWLMRATRSTCFRHNQQDNPT